MKPQNLTAVAALIIGIPALAMAQGSADANGDGMLTIDEVQAAFPEVTADAFAAMDVNADGALDEEEITAAQEAGLMPSTEG
ncbi:EF hand [Cribrihabitans marinus]|uniref:EF hand n=1 Tax=Cribrihabitans marinus TaxID=1227549 RepID=A0A1H7DYK6_9RHOB|nr:hypothetical protein [Cribrihabitans marinus]GGH17763.1 hypothetical protein GCM10010973_00110 [Cribrihabitans marinus]SEK06849.1 EF hand [Cribrihabitans marinus]